MRLAIQGTISDSNGAPLPDVELQLMDASRHLTAKGPTDQAGHYSFADVNIGLHRLVLQKTGYILLDQEISTNETAVFNVTLSSNTFSFRMGHLGSIDGTVLASDGARLQNVAVQLLRLRYGVDGVGYLEADPATPVARTNSAGEFTLADIPPGPWYLQAKDKTNGALYYPGTSDVAFAQSIALSPGSEQHALKLTFDAPSRVKVSGSIVSETPPKHVSFYLVSNNASYSRIVGPPLELSDYDIVGDRFEIRNVSAGSYDLYFGILMPEATTTRPRIYNPTFSVDRIPLTVKNEDVTDIRLTPRLGIEIEGAFMLDQAAAARHQDLSRVVAILRPKDGKPALLSPKSANFLKPTTADGHFHFQSVTSGEYYLLVSRPPDLYVNTVRLGSRVISPQSFDIGSDVDGPLLIELKGDGATFSGTVKDSHDSPAPDATVILLPPIDLRNDPESYRQATTNASGEFRITGIRPGRHWAYAFSKIDNNAWKNPDYMAQFAPLGTSIEFMAGEQRQLELKLLRPR